MVSREKGEAALANINPVARVLVVFLLGVPLLTTLDAMSAASSLVLVLAGCFAIGFDLQTIVKRTWPILLLAPLGGISMLLYARISGHVYVEFGVARISDGSISLAIAVTLRALALGIPAVMIWAGIDLTELAEGLTQLLRLPVRFVFAALAGTRLVALVRVDIDAVRRSRRTRGVGSWNFRALGSITLGLVVLSIRRSIELAIAMESRGFGPGMSRTLLHRSRLSVRDLLFLGTGLAVPAIAITVAVITGNFRWIWG